MTDQIVRFSRLLRIFELNEELAYIVELEEDSKKSLYISYLDKEYFSKFESYNDTNLKEEFKDLSDHCLMSVCTDASYMFACSHIAHFEADCSSLVYAGSMFYKSVLSFINTEFPLLEHAEDMFSHTKTKEITIDFPKLINGSDMFCGSPLEKITSQFPTLEDGMFMFEHTPLKEINCQFPKLRINAEMFPNTPPEFKQNYPHYFV